MAKKLYEEEDIREIANALRGKCGTTCGYKVCDMAAAIETIQNDGGDYDITVTENEDGTQSFAIVDAGVKEPVKLITKTIMSNGTYVAADDEADGYVSVTVDVGETVLENLSVITNGTYTPPEGVDGYNNITVEVKPNLSTLSVTANGTYIPPTGTDGYNSVTVDVVGAVLGPEGSTTITTNGTHDVYNYAEAVVNVQPVLQDKTVTANGVYSADEGYDGLGVVTVETQAAVIPETGFVPSEYTNGLMTNGTWYGTKVSDSAFYEWRYLTDVTFNDTVTEIGEYAFYYVTALTGLTELPDTITTIGNSAFYSCDAPLTKLPDSLTTLGDYAFRQSEISIQEIPSGVTEIPSGCFYWCSNLTSITLHSNITSIASNSFGHNNDTLTTINVPWAEGEVANAPWGATNATINYNYTG